jgi:glycyl-tRNA synthetase beta chain
VALADKIDTLVGFFAINEKPTGSGDPYALRRAAQGTIRIILENAIRLRLNELFGCALGLYQGDGRGDGLGYGFGHGSGSGAGDGLGSGLALSDSFGQRCGSEICAELLTFFADRLKVHLREQGVRHDLIAAVFATGTEDDLVRLLARVEALRGFLNTDDGANVLVAYRRASNIVRIEENREGVSYGAAVDPAMFAEPEETDLYSRLTNAHEGIAAALTAERFGEAMSILAKLRAPVDAFFDRVTVNCTDAGMRANRLRLLSRIRLALGDVADFSQIEG